MARKVAIPIDTATPFCSFVSYDDVSEEVYDIIQCGMGEFSLEFVGTISAPTAIKLTHNPTVREFGAFAFDEISVCAINGAGTGATTLQEVRDASAPYFFSNSGGGYTYSLTRIITSAEILEPAPGDGLASGLVLATAPAGKQFDWRLYWKLEAGATAYTSGGDLQVRIGPADPSDPESIVVAGFDVEHVTSATNRSIAFGQGYNIGEYKAPYPGLSLMVYSQSGQFLDGDGTIEVTLLYNLF